MAMARPMIPVRTIMMAARTSATNTILNGAGQLPISMVTKPWSVVDISSQMPLHSNRMLASTPRIR
jgi:hypothetical protein